MSCVTTNDEECLSFEDGNLVYVRDRHGVLRSPPGYEKSQKVEYSQPTVYGEFIKFI